VLYCQNNSRKLILGTAGVLDFLGCAWWPFHPPLGNIFLCCYIWHLLSRALIMLICITVQVFGLNPKAMVHFQLFLRLVKSIALLMVLAGLVLAILFTELSIGDVFASILAFVPTGWGIISVSF